MISYAWHDVVYGDSALANGEWAGVRVSTAAERRVVEAGRKSVCNTFVFQGCGYVLRLIVADDRPKLSLVRRMTLARTIKASVARHKPDVPQPLSTAILAVAVALVPAARAELLRVARLRRCDSCKCIFRAGGPVEPDSAQGRFISAELEQSQFMKGKAA